MPLPTLRAALLRCLLIASAAPALAAQPQSASQVAVDLPAGPLGRALNMLARQSGVQILFASEIAAGKESALLRGRYTVHHALRSLLSEHGLEGEERVPGVYVVRRPAAAAAGIHDSGRVADDADTAEEPTR